jgi:hypothetical protein
VSLAFVFIHGVTRAEARWILWSEDVGLEMVDLSLFLNSVDDMHQIFPR